MKKKGKKCLILKQLGFRINKMRFTVLGLFQILSAQDEHEHVEMAMASVMTSHRPPPLKTNKLASAFRNILVSKSSPRAGRHDPFL